MKKIIFLLILISLAISCISDSKDLQISKHSENDPFKETFVESQFFSVNSENNTIVNGKKGTIVVIPKDAFLDKDGKPVNTNIDFELTEAYTISDMIFSNLTTTSNGKLLETDGMIYINAKHKGENLAINKDKPIYIEIPTSNKIPNMSVYDGVRDENGNMNWINPKGLKNYLIPIDLELLDFLPEGFKDKAMVYLNYYKIKPTKKAIDSLYCNLPLMPKSKKYSPNTKIYSEEICGIEPNMVETLKDNHFNNTFIATKEFEERIKYLHKLCNYKFLKYYVDNLKEDLWISDAKVLDSLSHYPIVKTETQIMQIKSGSITMNKEKRVTKIMGYNKVTQDSIKTKHEKNKLLNKFLDFKNQKLTNVEIKSIYINELKSFYETQLKENIKKSDSLRVIGFYKEQNSTNRIAYNKLLKEREKTIKQSYGFVATEFGYKNIDKGTGEKDWNFQDFDITITNNLSFNQVHVYLIFKNVKSINKLITTNNKQFFMDKNMEIPIPKNSEIQIVAIAFNKDESYFSYKTIITQKDNTTNTLDLELHKLDFKSISNKLNALHKFDDSSNIIKDLYYSKLFETERQMKEDLIKIAKPCCFQPKDSILE